MIKSFLPPSNDENLYKYLIIIGLSLFLLYPIINNDLKEKHLKLIEISYDLQKEENNIHYLQNKLISEIKNFDGKDIYTLDDVEKILDGSKEMINLLPKDIKHVDKNSQEYKSAEESIKKICKAFQIQITGEIYDEDFFLQLDKGEEKFKKLESEYLEIGNKLTQTNLDFDKVKIEIFYINQQRIIEIIIRIVGILLIITGIFFWYTKIQKFNDIITKKTKISRRINRNKGK